MAKVRKPVRRTFYLQSHSSSGGLATILLEKAQTIIIVIVGQIDTLLEQLTHAYPAVSAMSSVMVGEPPVLNSPDSVLFRAAQFALEYDARSDLVCFQVSELRSLGHAVLSVVDNSAATKRIRRDDPARRSERSCRADGVRGLF